LKGEGVPYRGGKSLTSQPKSERTFMNEPGRKERSTAYFVKEREKKQLTRGEKGGPKIKKGKRRRKRGRIRVERVGPDESRAVLERI